jgi:hypothetical protein
MAAACVLCGLLQLLYVDVLAADTAVVCVSFWIQLRCPAALKRRESHARVLRLQQYGAVRAPTALPVSPFKGNLAFSAKPRTCAPITLAAAVRKWMADSVQAAARTQHKTDLGHWNQSRQACKNEV